MVRSYLLYRRAVSVAIKGIVPLLYLAFGVLSPFGCQEPIQPVALTVPVTVTVQVEDGNGSPVPNALVEFAPQIEGLNGQIQTTGSRGIYRIVDLEVPVAGEEYVFRVTAPPGDQELAGQSETRIVRLPCRDTLLTFVFVRTLRIQCGQLSASESMSLSACIDSADNGSLSFTNTTGLPLTVTYLDPGISDVDVVFRAGPGSTPQNSPFSLAQNESFTLDASFAPRSNGAGGSGSFVIEGRDSNGNLCYRSTVQISAILRPCDTIGPGICRIDANSSSILRSPPNDSIRSRVDSRGAGTLCIENIGESDLTVQASQVLNNPLFDVQPSELTIPPGGSECFTITFAPTTGAVWPTGRGNAPAIRRFLDSITIDGCGATFEVNGVPDTTFPAILNNCRTPYTYRNQHCGDRITESDQIVTECDKDSTEFDWYVDAADPVGRTGRLRSENALAPFKSVLSNFIPPSATGFSCSDPALAPLVSAACDDQNGWTNALNLSMGDVILFRKGNQCWVLFINSINDANVESKPLICYDICRLK